MSALRHPRVGAWKGKKRRKSSLPAPMAVAQQRRGSARVANREGPQEASFINSITATQRGLLCSNPWRTTGATRARRSRAGTRKPSLKMSRTRPRQAGKGESSRGGGGASTDASTAAQHGGGSRRTSPESGGDSGLGARRRPSSMDGASASEEAGAGDESGGWG